MIKSENHGPEDEPEDIEVKDEEINEDDNSNQGGQYGSDKQEIGVIFFIGIHSLFLFPPQSLQYLSCNQPASSYSSNK